MLALAINASPRKNGNTETLLGHVLEPIKEAGWDTEVIKIGGKPMQGCIACMECYKRKDKRCAVTRDHFNDIFARMLEADVIILGTPTYFANVTAELKALIDRSGYVSMVNGRLLAGKIGAGVVAVRRGGATHAFESINHLFQLNAMVMPGSYYWNIGYGLKEGEADNDKEGVANMRHLGQMIVWLGNAMKPHMDSFPR